MQKFILIFSLLIVNCVNTFASLKASQINAVSALSDISLVASMVLSILLLLFGYRKTAQMLGK